MQKVKISFLFIWIASSVFSQLEEKRTFTLDSLISVMPKAKVEHFENAHHYLDSCGKNELEKVYLFYGFIATHFKYDFKRMSDKNAPVFISAYTCSKEKGVCRDFARLFEDLCKRSNIPCMYVIGNGKTKLFNEVFKKKKRHANHAWNVVKINDEWKLIDATWSMILTVDKLKIKSEDEKTTSLIKVKHVSHEYFLADPTFFQKTHRPLHPAFYCNDSVPTWKKCYHVFKLKKFKHLNYDYSTFLNNLFQDSLMYCNSVLLEESSKYKKHSEKIIAGDFYFHTLKSITSPRPKTHPNSIEEINKRVIELKLISIKISKELHNNYFLKIPIEEQKKIDKLKLKLEKEALKAQKEKPKKK